MERERVICFVDGFNLYHALKNLNKPYLKWLDFNTLMHRFVRTKSQELVDVFFFSAYPTWPERKASYERHRKYVSALVAKGVTPVMGHFKNKSRKCLKCGAEWVGHEEKESDVNLALALLDLAHKDRYDHAYIVTRDSDMAPSMRKVKQNFPEKKMTVFSPFNYRNSNELMQEADSYKSIKLKHIKTSLFSKKVYDVGGNLVAVRPKEYTPPKD